MIDDAKSINNIRLTDTLRLPQHHPVLAGQLARPELP